MSVAVAVGPFTTSEDLEFAPLAELLGSCRASRPDVLLLIGPFVDVEHSLIASGSLDVTFEELFETQVQSVASWSVVKARARSSRWYNPCGRFSRANLKGNLRLSMYPMSRLPALCMHLCMQLATALGCLHSDALWPVALGLPTLPNNDIGNVTVYNSTVTIRIITMILRQVLGRLREFVEASPGTQVLLVPSGRDAHADPVFPQAAFPASGLPASIRQLPNPATFRLNEITVGVSSPDFLKQARP